MKSARSHGASGPCWYTSSLGGSPDTTPNELSSLQDHLSGCLAMRGRWFHWRRRTDALLSFVAARLITTALALGLVAALVWLL
jgi:hypothetical protein